MSTILTISDPHCGFMNPHAIDFLKDLKKTFKPDVVVCVGDLVDQYFYSQFDKDPDAMSAIEEEEVAMEQLFELYRLFPRVACCIGNHDVRLYKRAIRSGIPARLLPDLRKLFQAPKGWEFATRFIIDDILFYHGDGLSGRNAGHKAIELFRRNVVFGHLHGVAGPQYLNNGDQTIWALATSCLIDPTAYAFSYGHSHKDKPVIGTGLIIDNIPHYIPLIP